MLKCANQTSFKKGKTPWNKGLVGYRGGYKHTEKTKEKMRLTHKIIGTKPLPYKRNPCVEIVCKNCGKKFSVISSRKNKAKYCSRNCYSMVQKNWIPPNKGIYKSQTYGGLHFKVRKIRGTPRFCEQCATTFAKKYEWASSSGNYSNVSDYKRLCTSCHNKLDNKIQNIKKMVGAQISSEK